MNNLLFYIFVIVIAIVLYYNHYIIIIIVIITLKLKFTQTKKLQSTKNFLMWRKSKI